LVLGAWCFQANAQTNDLSGQTDSSISNILALVSHHQLRTLADGDYTSVNSQTAANNALKPVGIEWDYPWGVNLYGLLQVKNAIGDTNVENFVLTHNLIVGRYYSWLKSLNDSLTNTSGLTTFYNSTALSELLSLGKLDYCGAMGSQTMEGTLFHAGSITLEQVHVGQTTADYISTGQSRLPDGTLWRPAEGNTIWADDLYMSCPFLIRWYRYTGDQRFLDDAARQVRNIAGYLQDTNGVWFHGYFVTNHTVNGFKWGRANGWAMVANTEVLSVMPLDDTNRLPMLDILRRQIEGIKPLQAPDGLWRQVLDNTNLWEETSCTAMFAYSIARAVNRGWIDPSNMAIARTAFAAIAQQHIQTNGVITGTCEGTGIGTTLSFYANRTTPSDDMHGRGPVMLAGSEILLSPKVSITARPNQITLSWPGGLTNFTLETSTDLHVWTAFSGSPFLTNWQNVLTVPASDGGLFRLRSSAPVAPPAPFTFEAESLSYSTNGATASLQSDTNASAGAWVLFNSTGTNSYIEFTLPNVPSGTYDLRLSFKCANNRAQLAFSVDGALVGSALDQYWTSAVFTELSIGTVNFASSASHPIRLAVSGKSAASKGYTLAADKFMLMPR
jgi:rhamnogalacturonyl hydrolase YesR